MGTDVQIDNVHTFLCDHGAGGSFNAVFSTFHILAKIMYC